MAGVLEETSTGHANAPLSSSSIPQLCCVVILWCSHQERFIYPGQLSYLNLNSLLKPKFPVKLRNYEGLENAWPQHASYTHAARA